MSSENDKKLKEAMKKFHKELWVEAGCPPPKYSDFKANGEPNFVQKLGQYTVNNAKKLCPRGVGKGGGLMGSLKYKFEFKNALWFVYAGTNVKYAKDVEDGSPPHKVNPVDLELWVKRKLNVKDPDEVEEVAYLVSRKIAKWGIEEQPYLKPGAEEAARKVKEEYGL